MTHNQPLNKPIPLFLPHSCASTELNKTGSWRYVRPLYDEKTSPCSAACPLGEDIAHIERLVACNLMRDAAQTLLIENPFPAVFIIVKPPATVPDSTKPLPFVILKDSWATCWFPINRLRL